MQPSYNTDGKEAVLDFNFYIDLLTTGQIADSKRFDKEFFEAYPLAKPNSPLHMMFCTFVGALDLAQAATEFANKKDLDQEDAETTK